MSRAQKKLLPVGSNMNDAAYPFRGPHRMEDCINHGHTGVSKKAPTSVGMRITGSNLVIEQVQTPKGVELECELGVDGGIPRPVSLQQAAALMVPGDGHDYNLTATVKANGSATKHYCKLTFNGSEGTSVLRVRAPEGCHADAVYIVADGRRLRPTAGWFRIPIQAKDCSLVANMPLVDGQENSGSHYLPAFPSAASFTQDEGPGQQRSPTRGGATARSPMHRGGSGVGNRSPNAPGTPANAHFFLETIRAPASVSTGANVQPALICASTGQVIALAEQGTVAVPFNGAPYRLVLPTNAFGAGNSLAATPAGESNANLAVPELETRIQAPAPQPASPIPAAVPGVEPVPVGAAAPTGMPSFVASAPGFNVQLIGEDGSSAAGQGVASLPLTHRRAQAIQILVTDAQGNVVARQKSHVPALQPTPATVQLSEDANGTLTVATGPGNRLTVGGVPQLNPAAGTALPRVVPQQVVVEQPNADGSVASLALDVSAKGAGVPVLGGGVGPAPVPTPLGVGAATVGFAAPTAATPAAAGGTASGGPEKWVMDLCTALQKNNAEEQRRLVQAIQPSTLPAMTIVNFVRDQLTRQPPAISFTISKSGLEAVQCPGCTISATVGSDPARNIPTFGSVALTPGKPAVLTATNTSSQRPVSACRVQMSMMMNSDNAGAVGGTTSSSSPGYSPYGTASPSAATAATADGKADSDLVTRVVDSLLRHDANAALVANELAGMSTAPFSAQGRRMVPLLTNCLRSASATGAAAAAAQAANDQAAAAAAAAAAQAKPNEEIFFTCGPGYVDNIYTSAPQLHLFGAIDEQAPQVLQQRSRLPAQGVLEGEHKPFFIRLSARDPATGAVKVERTITVLGVRPPTATPAPAASAAPPAAPTTVTPLMLLSGDDNPNGPGAGASAMQAGGEAARTEPAPPAFAAAGNTHMPYIDVSLQTVGQDVQARFLCPPHLRIVCDVDGVGGHTGQSDFVTKMLASRFHHVNLSLVDAYGRVVFQQKLDVPAMTSPAWGLAVQHNGLAVDPESGSLATASVDRAPERALQGNFVGFDASVPHFVHLRKYLNGIHGSCVGEVSLRLPGLTLPPELVELTTLLRKRATGQLSDSQAKLEVQQLRARCATPAVSELITSILESWSGFAQGPQQSGRDSPSSRVFFRLTGSD